MPAAAGKLQHYKGERPIFDLYAIDEEIAKALARRVELKSGGYLIVDQTEALTTVDVNTGGFVGARNFDETIFKTNLEAAGAIARQLRLRNLGGIVIADFIDMTREDHREAVLAEVVAAEGDPSAVLTLVAEVVRMLCAGVVHGDLSEFNVLLAADGPVIIDLPQAVDAAGNNHAQRMLMRDVGNLRDFFGQFAPELRQTEYGPEIWSLYQAGLLSNETPLTGRFERSTADVDMQAVLREVDDARDEEAARRLRMAAAA